MANSRPAGRAVRHGLLLASASLIATLSSFPATASHSWNNYHWSKVSGLAIRVGDNVTSGWDGYLDISIYDWSRAAPLDMIEVPSSVAPETCSPTYGRIEVCNAHYGANGWLGLGQVWTVNGHIVQGTSKLNDTYFAKAKYNKPEWRRFVMCQELGHTIGLDHQDVIMNNANLGSCMDYTSDPSGTLGTNGILHNKRPNKHDYQQLALIYQHTDSSQLSSTKPASSTSAAIHPRGDHAARLAQPIGRSAREWGRAIARDARQRPRLFVRDLGGGVQVSTFVIWTEDAELEHGEH